LESVRKLNYSAWDCTKAIDEIIEAAFKEGTDISQKIIRYQEGMNLLITPHEILLQEIKTFKL
jgi:hypothetical protein